MSENLKLLQLKVQQLSGNVGLERMESALSDTRTRFIDVMVLGSSLASSSDHVFLIAAGSSHDSSSCDSRDDNVVEGHKRVGYIVPSLSKGDDSSLYGEVGSATHGVLDDHQNTSSRLVKDNEMLVNDIVHGIDSGLADGLNVTNDNLGRIKVSISAL